MQQQPPLQCCLFMCTCVLLSCTQVALLSITSQDLARRPSVQRLLVTDKLGGCLSQGPARQGVCMYTRLCVCLPVPCVCLLVLCVCLSCVPACPVCVSACLVCLPVLSVCLLVTLVCTCCLRCAYVHAASGVRVSCVPCPGVCGMPREVRCFGSLAYAYSWVYEEAGQARPDRRLRSPCSGPRVFCTSEASALVYA